MRDLTSKINHNRSEKTNLWTYYFYNFHTIAFMFIIGHSAVACHPPRKEGQSYCAEVRGLRELYHANQSERVELTENRLADATGWEARASRRQRRGRLSGAEDFDAAGIVKETRE